MDLPGATVASNTGKLTEQALRDLVEAGQIDTVLVAITDMQGSLQGKRCGARYFLEEVLAHGTEGCNYLLAVDVDMNTVDGYDMSSWARGYGDLLMSPDLDTLRLVPWLVGTGLYGIETELELEPMLEGNAYESDQQHVPTTLREAAALFTGSKVARQTFGDEMVDHYANAARVELDAYDAVVTDWERVRGFERL